MLFFSKKNEELEELVRKVDLEASNNYKDAAQEAFVKLENRFHELKEKNLLKPKVLDYYESIVSEKRNMMKDFHH